MFDSLRPHELQHTRLPCLSLSPGVCSDSCPLCPWCYLTISSSVIFFSFCLQTFPTTGSFPMSQLFASGGQNIGDSASASVLLMSVQGWFLLRLTDLISYCPKDSQESSSAPQFKSISSFALFLLYGPALTFMHDDWKVRSLDNVDLCQQSDFFAF